MTTAPESRSAADSFTEMVEVLLPNDANPLGFALGGVVMHHIDIAAAIAAHRHVRTSLVTAAVDGLQFLCPIRIGDLIILHARLTATFRTSLEVEVEVFSEALASGSGERRRSGIAYLTFVTVGPDGIRPTVPPLRLDTDEDRERAQAAAARRAARLEAKRALTSSAT
jgi:acyl-CoA hydrolase